MVMVLFLSFRSAIIADDILKAPKFGDRLIVEKDTIDVDDSGQGFGARDNDGDLSRLMMLKDIGHEIRDLLSCRHNVLFL
jgi:hypothetical protein